MFKAFKYRLYPNKEQEVLLAKHFGHCSVVNKELKLSDRIWECKACGSVNERDLLAARNIKKFALKNHSGQGLPVEPVESLTVVRAKKQEAQPIGYAVGG